MADFVVVELSGDEYFNLIPSRFPAIRVFERISSDHHDEVANLETMTNPRLKAKRHLLGGAAPVDADIPAVQNWNHAPFTYRNPEGSRFFPSENPALELAADKQTAILLAVTGRERFLSRTSEDPIDLEMRQLTRTVRGRFADLRQSDVPFDREQRRAIGRNVVEAGLDGILFHPEERPSATCATVLTNEAFGPAKQGRHFKFLWDGSRVGKIYDFSDGATFLPEELADSAYVLAA